MKHPIHCSVNRAVGFIDIVAIDITDIVPKIMKQSLEVIQLKT